MAAVSITTLSTHDLYTILQDEIPAGHRLSHYTRDEAVFELNSRVGTAAAGVLSSKESRRTSKRCLESGSDGVSSKIPKPAVCLVGAAAASSAGSGSAAEQLATVHTASLPQALLGHIAGFLPPRELAALTCTSKENAEETPRRYWRQVSDRYYLGASTILPERFHELKSELCHKHISEKPRAWTIPAVLEFQEQVREEIETVLRTIFDTIDGESISSGDYGSGAIREAHNELLQIAVFLHIHYGSSEKLSYICGMLYSVGRTEEALAHVEKMSENEREVFYSCVLDGMFSEENTPAGVLRVLDWAQRIENIEVRSSVLVGFFSDICEDEETSFETLDALLGRIRDIQIAERRLALLQLDSVFQQILRTERLGDVIAMIRECPPSNTKNVVLGGICIDHFVPVGELERVEELLDEFSAQNWRDEVNLTLVDGYMDQGRVEEAAAALERIESENLRARAIHMIGELDDDEEID